MSLIIITSLMLIFFENLRKSLIYVKKLMCKKINAWRKWFQIINHLMDPPKRS